jgi:hypothetical protein
VSSVGSPRYALAGFLQKMLGFLAGDTDSLLIIPKLLIYSLQNTKIERRIILVSFVVINLPTNLATDQGLPLISSFRNISSKRKMVQPFEALCHPGYL